MHESNFHAARNSFRTILNGGYKPIQRRFKSLSKGQAMGSIPTTILCEFR